MKSLFLKISMLVLSLILMGSQVWAGWSLPRLPWISSPRVREFQKDYKRYWQGYEVLTINKPENLSNFRTEIYKMMDQIAKEEDAKNFVDAALFLIKRPFLLIKWISPSHTFEICRVIQETSLQVVLSKGQIQTLREAIKNVPFRKENLKLLNKASDTNWAHGVKLTFKEISEQPFGSQDIDPPTTEN